MAEKEEHRSSTESTKDGEKTKILIAVSQSTIKGYPKASISSSIAFQWVMDKLIKPHASNSRCDFVLNILHVQVPDDDDLDDFDSVYESLSDFQDMKKRETIRGLHLLEHFVKICDESKVPCKAWLQKGDPKEVICKEAARVHPDILVLGSRGLRTMQRMFVGTVSAYCSTHATCPVLVIKRKPENAPDDPMDD